MSRGNSSVGHYFALLRVWTWLRGGSAERSESNWLEAYCVGLAIYLLTYLTLVAQLSANAVATIALLFVTWLGWLLLFYLNSLVVRALRSMGALRGLSNSRAQNILIGAETIACAISLTLRPGWEAVGYFWLIVSAANLAGALILRLLSPHDA